LIVHSDASFISIKLTCTNVKCFNARICSSLQALPNLLLVQIKQQLYQLVAEQILSRINDAETAIAEARKASENDTKSSAGDKYETGRAMMQQEIDLNSRQLLEARKLQALLQQINADTIHYVAQTGSLVETNQGDFYLAVGSGALFLDGKKYFAISAASPMGLQLKGKKAGDDFKLNGKEFKILSVL
jgi:transcription elongation GreA/GreB family factor